ncbi:hypothetical protein T265_09041 [Opisthorchis viverrini]|uniref:Uncharacterized protein n=1 Tax=Opisthorchis viverrini TaxID=6198 RepID=A0A074Z779_OPIVI|nr:hypothetical protein T265_09041 [Opisthorchis viverrini]KER22953.1 hypothetical protein T265_09041 [Opisthorchis viverrini]
MDSDMPHFTFTLSGDFDAMDRWSRTRSQGCGADTLNEVIEPKVWNNESAALNTALEPRGLSYVGSPVRYQASELTDGSGPCVSFCAENRCGSPATSSHSTWKKLPLTLAPPEAAKVETITGDSVANESLPVSDSAVSKLASVIVDTAAPHDPYGQRQQSGSAESENLAYANLATLIPDELTISAARNPRKDFLPLPEKSNTDPLDQNLAIKRAMVDTVEASLIRPCLAL